MEKCGQVDFHILLAHGKVDFFYRFPCPVPVACSSQIVKYLFPVNITDIENTYLQSWYKGTNYINSYNHMNLKDELKKREIATFIQSNLCERSHAISGQRR